MENNMLNTQHLYISYVYPRLYIYTLQYHIYNIYMYVYMYLDILIIFTYTPVVISN